MECSLHLGQGQVEVTGGKNSMSLGQGGLAINGQSLESMVREIAREAAQELISQMKL